MHYAIVLKSGLRILIQAPQVPFLVPPKTPKMGDPLPQLNSEGVLDIDCSYDLIWSAETYRVQGIEV